LFVGDSGVDMQTARNAGLTAVGVTWGFRDKEELKASGAHHIIERAKELLTLL
ncbi:MAG: HAD family hydrolase, partial [Clostridia bacterium]|nr:HAD family hydrolase [Clostridia bacterium]